MDLMIKELIKSLSKLNIDENKNNQLENFIKNHIELIKLNKEINKNNKKLYEEFIMV